MAEQLLKGFRKFFEKEYTSHMGIMEELVEKGQKPDYFIISCIDSRSNPGTIFRPKPGTFFAHKAMGAIVRPYKRGTALSAALQFALNYNKVREIIILGHTDCGAIEALISNLDDEEISSFLDVTQSGLEIAKQKCGPECTAEKLQRHTEEEIVLQSVENLKAYPTVAKALEENRVTIRPWLFDMTAGNLLEYDPKEEKFIPLLDLEHA